LKEHFKGALVLLKKDAKFDQEKQFNSEYYFSMLKTNYMGQMVMYGPKLSSTQLILYDFKDIVDEGTMVLTDFQTEGKGRGSNIWVSPEGCLSFSFLCTHKKGETLPHIQYIASMALIRAINQSVGQDIGIKLKWPNDIFYSNKEKIGGVLCQSTYDGIIFKVVIGIGLNLLNEKPTTCISQIISNLNIKKDITREEILANFFNNFIVLLISLQKDGFDSLQPEYYQYWLHSNQQVRFKEAGIDRDMIIEGLTTDGYLKAKELSSGNYYELHPDTTSLNFWDGFITRKIEGHKI